MRMYYYWWPIFCEEFATWQPTVPPSRSSTALSILVTAALIRQRTGRDISRRGLSPARALLSSNFNAIIFANLEQCNNVSAHQTFITLQLSLHLPELIKHWWVWGSRLHPAVLWELLRAEETKGEYRNYVYHSGGMFFIATRGGFQHLLGSSSCEESLWVSTYLHIYISTLLSSETAWEQPHPRNHNKIKIPPPATISPWSYKSSHIVSSQYSNLLSLTELSGSDSASLSSLLVSSHHIHHMRDICERSTEPLSQLKREWIWNMDWRGISIHCLNVWAQL